MKILLLVGFITWEDGGMMNMETRLKDKRNFMGSISGLKDQMVLFLRDWRGRNLVYQGMLRGVIFEQNCDLRRVCSPNTNARAETVQIPKFWSILQLQGAQIDSTREVGEKYRSLE